MCALSKMLEITVHSNMVPPPIHKCSVLYSTTANRNPIIKGTSWLCFCFVTFIYCVKMNTYKFFKMCTANGIQQEHQIQIFFISVRRCNEIQVRASILLWTFVSRYFKTTDTFFCLQGYHFLGYLPSTVFSTEESFVLFFSLLEKFDWIHLTV